MAHVDRVLVVPRAGHRLGGRYGGELLRGVSGKGGGGAERTYDESESLVPLHCCANSSPFSCIRSFIPLSWQFPLRNSPFVLTHRHLLRSKRDARCSNVLLRRNNRSGARARIHHSESVPEGKDAQGPHCSSQHAIHHVDGRDGIDLQARETEVVE